MTRILTVSRDFLHLAVIRGELESLFELHLATEL